MGQITVYNGDILTSDADVIVQQVNCCGIMGAGLAKQIKERWPKVFEEYKRQCELPNAQGYDRSHLLGKVQCSKVTDCITGRQIIIANIFGQNRYGTDKRYTDYKALTKGFIEIADGFNGKIIAIPEKIGCGLAGGDWKIVSHIIAGVFADTTGAVQIWKYNRTAAL